MPFSNIFAQLDNEYYQLTSAEKRVADYVVAHQRQTQYMSISELAENCNVAEATISRFCRRMGYKGYSAFKLAVANSVTAGQGAAAVVGERALESPGGEHPFQELLETDVEAILQTGRLNHPEEIRRAAELLLGADTVLCMGQGGSMIMAQEAAHLFSTIRPGFFAVQDSHLQSIRCAQLTERDVVFYFSYSGATRDLTDVLKQARERQASVILITRFPKSPAAVYANVVLQCGSNESPTQLGTVAARMAQLFLLDILYHDVCALDPEGAAANQDRVARALSEKHL
ncbi:RpiR family transcriptional regulator [Flavonifractor sp. An92]|uniref:MurR/RpiR family transcriptional regulator n=1 Tax=Flavonifractor sp. An92 TaxID=1965666 RepID=UPI000B393D7B|nr:MULTISPECIES: MurR/RpiR family transcriptional regulator [unclassified Flavonifractor]OUN03731.1 RpiR family transcriptional regulator [Flavonifractor sp. An92]OUQ22505.1 RpiR family transcriptional regulator [Flavonifractor sp. An135]